MRLILALAVLAACGGDDSSSGDDAPGDAMSDALAEGVVACDATWGTPGYPNGCERQCETRPIYNGPSCFGFAERIQSAGGCPQTFTFEGARGCCNTEYSDMGSRLPVMFIECDE